MSNKDANLSHYGQLNTNRLIEKFIHGAVITRLSVLVVLFSAVCFGADTRWFGNDEDWTDTDFWVGGLIPTEMHSAQIDGSVIVSKAGAVVGKGFYVGYSYDGLVRIVGGDLTTGDTAQTAFFGYSGKGTLEMLDGVYTSRSNCNLGYNPGGEGIWTVEGGIINAEQNTRVGDAGTGSIIQTDGTVSSNGISLGYEDGSSGTYVIYGGTLSTSWLRLGQNSSWTTYPTFEILGSSADISLTGSLSFYASDSIFNAVSGSKIKMVGQYANFINELDAISQDNVSGLKNLTLEFSGNAAGSYCTYEAASEDIGADVSGYCGGNFTINTLAVGGDTPGRVRLIDSFDNGNRSGANECLYVRKLIVRAGSTLDLNGLNLYYLQGEIEGTINGTPERIWAYDMNGDGVVGEYELLTIADYWLYETCGCPDFCGGADLDANGNTDLFDFAVLAANWQATDSSLFYAEYLDDDPGWAVEGEWAFGAPTGGGGVSYGNPDPTGGATGSNVYGVNLSGDYSVASLPSYRWVTTPAIDCSGRYGVELRFKRWLNVDVQSRVIAMVDVYDGSYWYNYLWYNGSVPVTDSGWVDCAYDISEWADNNPELRIRWGYWVKTGALPYSGWNIDDIELWENP
jgi:hypothetical protein